MQGHVLSVTSGTWSGSPTAFTYAWKDCNLGGTSCTNIGGATASTHLLNAADVGHTLRVEVTARSPFGATVATSGQSGRIAPPPAPNMSTVRLRSSSFRAKQGSSLMLSLSEPATVTVMITGRLSGHRVHGHCTTSARKGKRCSLAAKPVKLTFKGSSGANRFALIVRSLTPGKYTATITARDSGGRQSKPSMLRFTIKIH